MHNRKKQERIPALPFFEYSPAGCGAEADGSLVLFHDKRPEWILANRTFAEIARLLVEDRSVEEAADVMRERYSVSPQQATKDVRLVREHLDGRRFLGDSAQTRPERSPRLKSLFIYVTDRCNLSCSHCYYTDHSSRDIPTDAYKKMIDEMVNLGGTDVTLTGGEAFLHPDLKEMLLYGNGRCAPTLLTNGTLIDESWASFLGRLQNASVQISIDGARQETHDAIRGKGVFAKALRAVDLLQEAGLGDRINFAATVMSKNISELPDIIRLAQDKGVPKVRFLPLRKQGRARRRRPDIGAVTTKQYERFFDFAGDGRRSRDPAVEVSCGLSGFLLEVSPSVSPDGIWCPVGFKLVVTPAGRAFPCALMQAEEFFLGNVFEEGLAAVMRSAAMQKTCGLLTERIRKIADCAACSWRNFCQAGCMGDAFEDAGTVWDKGRFCVYRKKLYEKAFCTLACGRKAEAPLSVCDTP
ncbi:MAG: PqqD family peptide modification chaperone [Syntrophaceae bacterium]|nr:PqqD family peptide modification chaperone [Syntrophaceae bacterium]